MIVIPFLFFSILLCRQLYKNNWKFDIASLIFSIYAVSGFFSMLIDAYGMRSIDTKNYNISPLASIAYCGLLTLCAWPFMSFSNLRIKEIKPLRNSGWLKFFAYLLFCYSVLNFVMSYDNVMYVLTSDDMAQIRGDFNKGYVQEGWVSKLPFSVRIPFTLLNMMSGCSWIFIFFAFFCTSIQKLPMRFFLMFFIASISGVIENLTAAGRSAAVYWIIGAVACYLFFLSYIGNKTKRWARTLFLVVIVLFVGYLTALTISRFGETSIGEVEGSQGGVILYLGQSYINFCYFFDTYECPFPTFQVLFPFTYRLIGYPIQGTVALQEFLSQLSHKELNVFYTFIGHILVTTNIFLSILYCIILYIASILTLKKIRKGIANPITAYLYLSLSSVLFLGLFGHYYAGATNTTSFLIWLALLYFKPKFMK